MKIQSLTTTLFLAALLALTSACSDMGLEPSMTLSSECLNPPCSLTLTGPGEPNTFSGPDVEPDSNTEDSTDDTGPGPDVEPDTTPGPDTTPNPVNAIEACLDVCVEHDWAGGDCQDLCGRLYEDGEFYDPIEACFDKWGEFEGGGETCALFFVEKYPIDQCNEDCFEDTDNIFGGMVDCSDVCDDIYHGTFIYDGQSETLTHCLDYYGASSPPTAEDLTSQLCYFYFGSWEGCSDLDFECSILLSE